LTTGFSPGDLVILAARPAMGKTSLVMNFAMNVARSGNGAVACFNLEMPGEQLVQRLISMLSTVPIESMRRTGLSTESYDKIIVAAEQLVSLPIFIDDTSQLSALDMIARCRRLQMDLDDRVRRDELDPQGGRLALVIVDYLQLMRAQRGSDNRVQEVSEIARGLKLMARELRVPVIALSQLSREVEKRPNKRPQLSDLRESGSIEADADLVAFIYRDEYYRQKEEGGGDDFHENPEHTEASEVIIAKHRNGATGTVLLGFQPSLTRFWSLANEDKEDYWRSKRRQNFADD
jgi:replicative DNA helicase